MTCPSFALIPKERLKPGVVHTGSQRHCGDSCPVNPAHSTAIRCPSRPLGRPHGPSVPLSGGLDCGSYPVCRICLVTWAFASISNCLSLTSTTATFAFDPTLYFSLYKLNTLAYVWHISLEFCRAMVQFLFDHFKKAFHPVCVRVGSRVLFSHTYNSLFVNSSAYQPNFF